MRVTMIKNLIGRYSRLIVAAFFVLTIVGGSSGLVAADLSAPVTTVDTSGLPSVDPTTTLDAAKKVACGFAESDAVNMGAQNGQPLVAQVNTDPIKGTIQYVWSNYDYTMENGGGSAEAWVPDNGCAKYVEVDSQMVDTTQMPGCNPYVASKVEVAYDTLQNQLADGTKILVGKNTGTIKLAVLYYGYDSFLDNLLGLSNTNGANLPTDGITIGGTGVSQPQVNCARSLSQVTVTTNAYYINNVGKRLWFTCVGDNYQIIASPAGPAIVHTSTFDCSQGRGPSN